MLTLYYFTPACSTVSHIVLEESGLAYEAKLARPGNAEERAELIAINPRGTVPTLKVEDIALTENVAIMSYVAGQAREVELMPRDPMEQAQCLSFLAWCSNTVHISFRQWALPMRFSPDETAHAGLKDSARDSFWGFLQQIDARLQQGDWIMGDQYSVADSYPLVFYGWSILAGLPVKELAALTSFKTAMLERPAVQTVLQREESILLRQQDG